MAVRNILVPIDFSAGAEYALDYACMLAGKLDATVHLVNALGAALPELTVSLSESVIATARDANRASLEKLVAARGTSRFGKRTVASGDPRDAILAAAEDVAADLIVMGTHGRRGIARFVIGSVAENVVRRAPCPVLTVRQEKTS